MEGNTVCFLVTLVVLLATRRGTTTEDNEFREANLPSLLSSNEGSCIKSVPQCAGCLDHRTCQRCQEGFLLIESYWGALCVASCPGGFTKIQTKENGLVCKKSEGCSTIPNCSQCEEKFDDICDRCEDGFLLLQQGTGVEVQCVASCPAGFVKHGTRCRAEMCEDFFCSRCKEGWVLQYKGGTKCLSNCPSGFYRKEDWYSDQAYCDMCRANCKSCQDSYNCDVCEDSFFLLEGVFSKCVQTCPVGYLPENTQSSLGKVCKTDKLGCLDQSCSQCQEGWYRIRIRKVYHCRMECPSGYFGIQQAGKPKICGRCPYNCQECLSPRECRKCKSGLYKLERGGRVHCVWHCPPDYLPDENNNEEKRCVKATDDILGRL